MSYSENMINNILDQVEEHLPQIRKATEEDFNFIVCDPKEGFKNSITPLLTFSLLLMLSLLF